MPATFRDLNHNGVLDPYEDVTLSPQQRTEDLLGRLSLAEKVGLMFQTVIETGPGGAVLETPGQISKSPTSTVVLDKAMNHFNVHGLEGPLEAARWNNAIQRLAEQGPHGIPVTVSTDPRHAFVQNSGVSFAAKSFSQWPETLGLAAIDDLELIRTFADVARQEYAAVGIRSALHPQVDLATEPRWGRQAGTFGHDAQRVSEYVTAYLQGFQGDQLGRGSVACVTKHFPGGGPQLDGEDAHFPYGREQIYPGGQFDYHLEPFRAAIAAGTAGLMPYYGMPVDLEVDLGDGPEPIEAVGFGYNHQIITRLLRERLGYDGVVVTDWELVMDNHVGDQVLPARAWGVEALDPHGRMLKIISAGCDQLGGEECVDVLLDLVGDGRVSEQRIDESARRLLLVKFQLGLFDDPYVDEDAAVEIVGRADFADAGFIAQARSVTVLENRGVLPVASGSRLYVEDVAAEVAAEFGTVVDDPDGADVAIVRLTAPFQPRDDLFLEAWFHQGTLEFTPGLVYRIRALAARTKLIIVVNLDRPAILTPLVEPCAALVVTFGVSDRALLTALSGTIAPEGRLPMEIPRSMDAIRVSRTDVPSDTVDPVYPLHAGMG